MSLTQWDEYLQSYYEQKRLEQYQKDRPLARPKTTIWCVLLHLTAVIAVILSFCIWLCAFSGFLAWVKLLFLCLYIFLVAETYGRLFAIKVVECYQHYAPEATRRKCKCVPSCSEYAILCLKKYELIYGLLKIRRRLFVTCKGFDYIIDDP